MTSYENPIKAISIMTDEEMKLQREQNLNDILLSESTKKVIVAGPGTGKTFTFGKILDIVDGNALVLSFLGNLVSDLEKDLGDRATVRTFHAYCRGRLHHMSVDGITRNTDYFPSFSRIIDSDLQVIRERTEGVSAEKAFMYLDDSLGVISDSIQIGNYYDAVGHTDSVYRVYDAFKNDTRLIPTYVQILVDEYQDFSFLETSLIDLLSTASPTLIAGDDDQALYGFRHASADYLRELVTRDEYERFCLPFCTRCTQVLVNATHTVVSKAQGMGLLQSRLDKEYICYLPEKRDTSDLYPKIRHARCTVERNNAPYMCKFVAQEISKITAADIELSKEKGNPTVLIIAPSQFGRRIFNHLNENGVPNVERRVREKSDVEIIEGYKRLVGNESSRLGWRILLYHTQPPGTEDLIRNALQSNMDLVDLISDDFKSLHLSVVAILRQFVDGNSLTDDEQDKLIAAIGLPLEVLRIKLGLEEEASESSMVEDAARIVITTMSGAKGLQAEHVFVVGMNEGHFPKVNSAPTEDEVCQLGLDPVW